MGYGRPPATGLWLNKTVLTWDYYESSGTFRNFELALDIWQKHLSKVVFQRQNTGGSTNSRPEPDFFVKSNSSASAGWNDELKRLTFHGRESVGTCLHEIGHLLGISHEQDRPDMRKKFYKEHTELLFGLEGARKRQNLFKYVKYGDIDGESIMQYPESHYVGADRPSDGDISTAKAINSWS